MKPGDIALELYNGHEIGFRRADGYVNATALCQANGKLVANYLRNQTTREFLGELETAMRIRTADLVQIQEGGRSQGTWVHPRVAYNLGQWCNATCAVWVTGILEKLRIDGVVSIRGEDVAPHVYFDEKMLLLQSQIDVVHGGQELAAKRQLEDRQRLNALQAQMMHLAGLVSTIGTRVQDTNDFIKKLLHVVEAVSHELAQANLDQSTQLSLERRMAEILEEMHERMIEATKTAKHRRMPRHLRVKAAAYQIEIESWRAAARSQRIGPPPPAQP